MTAKELQKSKWHGIVIVNKLTGLCSEKKKQTGNSTFSLRMMITHITQSNYSFFSHPLSSFAVSVHSISTNLYNLLSLSSSFLLVAG